MSSDPSADWTPERFDEWVEAQEWAFARSMPFLPHEYVLIKDAADPEEWQAAVAFADRAGRPAKWPPKKQHSLRQYYVRGSHMYWHMNPPGDWHLAGVFNRCR